MHNQIRRLTSACSRTSPLATLTGWQLMRGVSLSMTRITLTLMLAWLTALLGCGSDSSERFLSTSDHEANVTKQMEMTPVTMKHLRQHGVSPESQLKLEYFFYTDSSAKAAALERSLLDLGYSSEHGLSASDDGSFVVTGWTTKMAMVDRTVVDWTRRMCDLGYDCDAEFDGWGTNPSQE